VDQGWTRAGTRRSVTYTNLEPGTYTFRVKLAGGGAATSLRIIITPPWWRTWWAYALYAVGAAALAYGLVKYLLDRERLRNLVELKKLESEKLQEINALKTTFFANVSHEFRTPLTLILGPLEDKLAATPPDHADTRTFRMMHRNANRLLQLVNQLLDVSKLEAGGMHLEVGRGDLLAYLDTLVHSFGSLAHGRGIHLAYAAPPGPGWAYFDRDKVEKILSNLLSNAFKFTPRGGSVRVTVQWLDAGRQPIPAPAAGPEAAFVRMAVADTGVGIPRSNCPHLRPLLPGRRLPHPASTRARASAWPSPANWWPCTGANWRGKRAGRRHHLYRAPAPQPRGPATGRHPAGRTAGRPRRRAGGSCRRGGPGAPPEPAEEPAAPCRCCSWWKTTRRCGSTCGRAWGGSTGWSNAPTAKKASGRPYGRCPTW
jgi:signal transduction histidine kinase